MTKEGPFSGITYRRKHTRRKPTPIREEDIPDGESEEKPKKGKGVEETLERPDMGDKEEWAFSRLLSAIDDLARGQKEITDLIRGMTNKGASTRRSQ